MKAAHCVLLTMALLAACQAPKPAAPPAEVNYLEESRADFDRRMAWWREARFGMFIHWGAYALPAGVYEGREIGGTGEWIMNNGPIPVAAYEEYARNFNPVKYDPERWVQIAKDAGMRYMVITSKHHEGFALWDSKVSRYDAVDFAAARRDLLRPLKEACDRAGIRLCFYYSIMDWHHPDAQAPHFPTYNTDQKSNPAFARYVESYLRPQLRELVTEYQPDVLWFDGEWIPEWTHEMGLALYQEVRSLRPSILINNRVDKGRAGMQGMNKDDQRYAGDFGTPEQEILEGSSAFDWESCMTMNDTWGFKASDQNWKSAENLIYNLADIAAKGGNYLLNVGPTAEGEIPEASVERLAAMGRWMRVNGEAIYGSRLWKHYQDGERIRFTQTADSSTVYVISLGWPGKSLAVNHLQPEEGSEIRLLGHDSPIAYTFSEAEGLRLELPASLDADPALRPCEYAFVFKVKGRAR